MLIKNNIFRIVIGIGLMAIPIVILFAIPMSMFFCGQCYGDLNMTGTHFFDSGYKSVFTMQPDWKGNVIVTSDFCKDVAEGDSTVLIMGDSYSQQGARSFMQCLAHEMPDWKVMNVRTLRADNDWHYLHYSLSEESRGQLLHFHQMTEFLVYFLQRSKVMPNVIVMESGACLWTGRMFNAKLNVNDADVERYDPASGLQVAKLEQNDADTEEKDITVIDELNSYTQQFSDAFDYSHSWIKRRFGLGNRVYSTKLDTPLFTCKGDEDQLYFHRMNLERYTEDEYARAIQAKNTLTRMAAEKGVRLLFLVCPDKLDVYRSHAVGLKPKYDVPSLFDVLRDKGAMDNVIDMKSELMPHVDAGEKDLYFCNDTHWTFKSAVICAKKLKSLLCQ